MKRFFLLFALGLLGGGVAIGQVGDSDPFASDDPYKKNSEQQKDLAPVADDKTAIVSVRYEAFSLPLETAANLQRENLSSSELYQKTLQLVISGEAKQERLVVSKESVGKVSSSESIAEYIYPTEYMPVEVSAESEVKEEVQSETKPENTESENESPKVGGDLVIAALASAFETRNTGVTFETVASVNSDRNAIGLLFSIEHVTLFEPSFYGEGLTETEMPHIGSQRLSASVVIPAGEPYFAGTLNELSHTRPEGEDPFKVWFAFLTPKID